MTAKVLEVAGATVQPGSAVRHSIKFVELADGSQVDIPLLLINGAKPGPRLYLGSAIHGDEVTCVEVLSTALANIDPAGLSGSIVSVPVQNPLAFHADHRFAMNFFMKSPLEQTPADAWSAMPGKSDGNLTQTLAHKLFSLIRLCDYAIDVHTPTRGGRYVPIALLPHSKLGEAAEKAKHLAMALGSGYVIADDASGYAADGVLCVEATRAGIPAFTFEIGEGGRLEPNIATFGAQCIVNAMKYLRMVEGAPNVPKTSFFMNRFINLRAKRGGLLHTTAELGKLLKPGDLIGQTISIFGDVMKEFRAPEEGVFIRATTLSTVAEGERVAALGAVSAS